MAERRRRCLEHVSTHGELLEGEAHLFAALSGRLDDDTHIIPGYGVPTSQALQALRAMLGLPNSPPSPSIAQLTCVKPRPTRRKGISQSSIATERHTDSSEDSSESDQGERTRLRRLLMSLGGQLYGEVVHMLDEAVAFPVADQAELWRLFRDAAAAKSSSSSSSWFSLRIP